MEQQILINLQLELYKKYAYLRNNHFISVYIESDFICLNWNPINDLYINYNKLEKIKVFMYDFLKRNKQEGYFYVGDLAIKV